MKDFLRKLKLVLNFETKIPISKTLFVERLSNITEKGNIGIGNDFLSLFDSSKKEFVGTVTYDGFKIKRRKRFIDTNVNIAYAEGTYIETNKVLEVKAEIFGFNNFFLFWYVGITAVFLLIISVNLIYSTKTEPILLITLTLQALFAYIFPYFMMRKSAKRLAYELERDFYYLTKNENSKLENI